MRTVRFAAIWGATLGIGIAVVMLSLSEIKPFSDTVNAVIVIVTVSLCPIFLLGSTLYIKSKTLVVRNHELWETGYSTEFRPPSSVWCLRSFRD
jgi:uncharacterized membrane protein YgaE (UPF0421/DUF939 family)